MVSFNLGIDINGMISNDSAWINYDFAKNKLNLSFSLSSTKPSSSTLTFQIDLSPIFEDTMYVGFSASIGLLASYHYIQGWSFNMSGQAQSLDLSSLPSLPGPKQSYTAFVCSCLNCSLVINYR
ncbi:hypothetical protein CsSME_00034405 [Camellia sinensis var. sinensis]